MPNYPCEFEIPNSWITEAGMDGFKPAAQAYCSIRKAVLVPLTEVEPPYRVRARPMDWRGFDHARMISVLRGIATGAEIEPVPLLELPVGDFPPAPFRYRVRDGFHRFYASIVAGFECLPGVIN